MAKVAGSNKKMLGSRRAQSGLVAKAGKRRPTHIKSKIDAYGKRQWSAV